jgi:hypothetical protein
MFNPLMPASGTGPEAKHRNGAFAAPASAMERDMERCRTMKQMDCFSPSYRIFQ